MKKESGGRKYTLVLVQEFLVRLCHDIARTNYSFDNEMGHIILDGIKWNIVVFFVFLLYGITFHSLPQDGRHPEKSPVNNDLQVK